MLQNFLGTVVVGLLMFVIVVGIILLIGIALGYVLTIIPCTVLAYIETGVLLGLFMLIGKMLVDPTTFEKVNFLNKK